MNTATAQYEVGSTYHVQPKMLLLERNIRDAKPDKQLIDSIKDLGVLEPIGAVVTADGALLVRSGHRRTLAAIAAKTSTVPVYVRGTDDLDPAAEVSRVISQHDENTHRLGLTTSEQVGVVDQLVLLGVPVDQVAKKARLDPDKVAAAVKVAESKLATASTDRYDLTLDQAAAIAEFEDDKDAVKALVAAASSGSFEHVVQRMRDDRRRAAARAALIDELTQLEIPVLERRPAWTDRVKPIERIYVDDKQIDAIAHASCPGHVAWPVESLEYVDKDGNVVSEEAYEKAWNEYDDALAKIEKAGGDETKLVDPDAQFSSRVTFVAEYGCSDPNKHGHKDVHGHSFGHVTSTSNSPADGGGPVKSEEQIEAERAARRLVIENNKAWSSAQEVRRKFIATSIAKLKTPPKVAARFIAGGISIDKQQFDYAIEPTKLCREWLGLKAGSTYSDFDLTKSAMNQTSDRALVIALVMMLAVYEVKAMGSDAWRRDGTKNATGRYLRFLETCGYVLSDVEKYAISKKTV